MSKIVILGKDAAKVPEVGDEVLRNLDIILCIDTSRSMLTKIVKGQDENRFDVVKKDVIGLAQMMENYDEDGLTLVEFSDDAFITDGVTAKGVEAAFGKMKPGGGTNLEKAIETALRKVERTDKEVVVFVFTDGSPDNAKAAYKVLNDAGQKYGRPKLGFIFIQVGDSNPATEFLRSVNHNLKVDIVACVSPTERPEFSLRQLIHLARTA